MLAVTSPARFSGDWQGLVRLLLTNTHTSADTFMHQHLAPLIQAVVVERFILAFLVPFA